MNLFKKIDKYSKITPATTHNRIKGVQERKEGIQYGSLDKHSTNVNRKEDTLSRMWQGYPPRRDGQVHEKRKRSRFLA